MKTAFITGASSGIGKATAFLLAENNINLVLCGRRLEKLNEIKNILKNKVSVHVLSFDIRHHQQVKKAIESLPTEFRQIDYLINNAGNAHGRASIQAGSLEDWETMIDLNIKGLLYVTKEILPIMLEKQSGHIVNIGSIAGIDAYANGNVYCATKSAVDMLSKTMRIDLLEEGIKVSEVKPGLVETEFSKVRFKGNEEEATKVYQNYTPLTAEDVADLIYFIISRPKHVNIADSLILPTDQASATMVFKK